MPHHTPNTVSFSFALADAALVVLTVLTLAGAVHAQTEPTTDLLASDTDFWRTTRYCGINAVYLMLKLNGITADYQQLTQAVPVDETGSNLQDMTDSLRERGLRVKVVKATPADLEECPLPCVAHVERDEGTRFSEEDRGHYIILLEVDERQIQYIDCTTSVMRTKPLSAFRREWSGYLLVSDSAREAVLQNLSVTLAASLVVVGSWWVFLRGRATTSAPGRVDAQPAPAP